MSQVVRRHRMGLPLLHMATAMHPVRPPRPPHHPQAMVSIPRPCVLVPGWVLNSCEHYGRSTRSSAELRRHHAATLWLLWPQSTSLWPHSRAWQCAATTRQWSFTTWTRLHPRYLQPGTGHSPDTDQVSQKASLEGCTTFPHVYLANS